MHQDVYVAMDSNDAFLVVRSPTQHMRMYEKKKKLTETTILELNQLLRATIIGQ